MIPSMKLCFYFLRRRFQHSSDFRFFSATGETSRVASTPAPASFLVGFLVSSCGFTKAEAAKVSASVPGMKTLANADAVVQFLRQKGLRDDNIRRVILHFPRVLCCRVSKTLEPKIRALQEASFSSSEIHQVISRTPYLLRVAHLEAKIDFWRRLLGSKDRVLKVMRDSYVVSCNLDKKIKPAISVLRETGLPEHRIAKILIKKPRVVTFMVDKTRSLIEQIRNLGFSTQSPMFELALYALVDNGKAGFDAKILTFKSLGWSEGDFFSAFLRSPNIVTISQKRIRQSVEFLVGEVGCEPSYVVHRPVLLTYSLKKRLVPRYVVLKMLKSKGLSAGRHAFSSAVVKSEDAFRKRYVIPYTEKVPGLLESYSAAIAKGNAKPPT